MRKHFERHQRAVQEQERFPPVAGLALNYLRHYESLPRYTSGESIPRC